MKKSIKVISTLLLAIMLVTSIAGTVLAVDPNTVLNGLMEMVMFKLMT